MFSWNDFNQYPDIWYPKTNYRKYITHTTNWTHIEHMSWTHKKKQKKEPGKIAQSIKDPLSVSEPSLLYIRKMRSNTNRQINICFTINACRKMRSQKPKRIRNVHQFRTLHVTRALNRIKRIIALSHSCALNVWCECANCFFFIMGIIYVELLLTNAQKMEYSLLELGMFQTRTFSSKLNFLFGWIIDVVNLCKFIMDSSSKGWSQRENFIAI